MSFGFSDKNFGLFNDVPAVAIEECVSRLEVGSLGLHPYHPEHFFDVIPLYAGDPHWLRDCVGLISGRGQLKCDGTRTETSFRLSAKRTESI